MALYYCRRQQTAEQIPTVSGGEHSCPVYEDLEENTNFCEPFQSQVVDYDQLSGDAHGPCTAGINQSISDYSNL